MSLLDTLIVSGCVSFYPGQSQDACNKALVASTKQSGIESNMNTTEDKTLKNLDKNSREYLGNTTANVIAGTAIVAKTVADKAATIRLPNFGICNSMILKVNHETSVLSLEWKY